MFLTQIGPVRDVDALAGHPFDLPVIRTLDRLVLHRPLTFFVGENGSGKSTLLEAIALASQATSIGGPPLGEDPGLAGSRLLAERLTLGWSRRTRRGFFLRAEDFIGFTRGLRDLRADLQADLSTVEAEFADRSDYARTLAMGPLRGSLAELKSRYGDLEARSHGESFLDVFGSRFVPGGLYLLDEPETPLSPQRQLAFVVMLHDMIEQGAQFIIATHSPILLAYPGAEIISFDRVPVHPIEFDASEHVGLYREILRDPGRFMARLLEDA